MTCLGMLAVTLLSFLGLGNNQQGIGLGLSHRVK